MDASSTPNSVADVGALRKWVRLVGSVLDPRVHLHVLRILHYYSYSHVRERRALRCGRGTGIAPNVSFRNGVRIEIGSQCHIGERAYLWAGDSTGRIVIGDFVSLAPEVFITASDYQFVAGRPFQSQPKIERNVLIGDDVWLGARVVVTAGVTIGSGCIVGAGAVVTRDLPSGSIAVGVPARVVNRRRASVEE
jgi:acetyltransferase-like isoleucine patch superfamily enzyme